MSGGSGSAAALCAGAWATARYLIQASYTPEAWDALVKNPVDRSQAIAGMLGAVGGKLITFDFAWAPWGDVNG